ncbi:MAG TPA: sialidase family protein, partial [Bacteroidales bacterium]|nr:sialidase family protein [Bacteroidales bacterium]
MPVLILCLLISLLSPGNISGEKDRGKSAGKRIILRLEPGPGNPRNSEGDFITLMDGRILFIYSRYTGGSGDDNDNAYLAGICSEDGGRTWSPPNEFIAKDLG